MLKDFKAFIMRGNVLDLAVAVIIGAAFGSGSKQNAKARGCDNQGLRLLFHGNSGFREAMPSLHLAASRRGRPSLTKEDSRSYRRMLALRSTASNRRRRLNDPSQGENLMMNELLNRVTEKTGLSPEQAKAAVDSVLGFLKEKLPAPLASSLSSLVGEGDGSAEGGSEGLGSRATAAVGNLFRNVS